jgi:Na+-transporting methylmalonyl-CoA/oxaloacetate decarboxylase gamma subunit
LTLVKEGWIKEIAMDKMSNFTFGVTMIICGMGGTILTLWIMSLIMNLLGKLFPYKKEKE